jgi:signal peptidase I
VTDPPDDPQLSWNPDAPRPGATAQGTPSPRGWVPTRKPPEPDEAPGAGPTGDEDRPPRHRRRKGKERDRVRTIVEWVAVVVGALVVALVVKTFLFQAFYIPSASMEPTLEKGDRVLVNKLSYDLHDIHRGDIVVFELPSDKVGPDGIKDLIKRAIGLPGDVIETREGLVYINGEKIDEPYLPDGVTTDKPPIPKQTVPDGHIYVLGDNRDNSADSRYEDRGPIPIDSVVGRAFFQVWPPGSIGGL